MAFKKTVVLAAVTTALLASSQAFAFRVTDIPPPPNGLNGPSLQGFNETFPAQQPDEFPVHSSKLTSVTFPDGSRAASN